MYSSSPTIISQGTYTNSTGDSTYLKDITISAGSNVTIQSHNSMRIQAGFTSNGATVSLKPGVITAGTGGGAGDYSEKNITYDANGNIKTLTRSTNPAIVYCYNSAKPNRLDSVKGGITARYTYDNNGNMLRDGNNKFGYDYRNMPITDTLVNGKIIRFAYDAGGQRIKYLRYASNGTTLLDSSRIFILNGGKIVAEYMYRGASWRLEHYNVYGNDLVGKLDTLNKRYYNLQDHLGSVRVTLKEDGSVDSWSDYYPFGKESRGSSTINEPKEQFTGKERDSESGLDYFGARYYNSEIARWVVVDPMHQYASGYVYVGNNPIILIDPTGMESAHSASAIDEFDKKVAASESGGVYSPQGGGGEEEGGSGSTTSSSSQVTNEQSNSNNNSGSLLTVPPPTLSITPDLTVPLAGRAIRRGMIAQRYMISDDLRIKGFALKPVTISKFSRYSGRIGTTAGTLGLIADFGNPKISADRFTFRAIGFVAAEAVGYSCGFWPGIATSIAFGGTETVTDWLVQSTAEISVKTERAVKNGWFFGLRNK